MRFTPEGDEVGGRVDAVIAARTGVSRNAVQEALKAGAILVGGRQVRPSHRLEATDVIAGEIEVAEVSEPQPEDIPLTIVHEDERLLVVSKPAGLVTHPAAGNASGTLVNALLGYTDRLSRIDPMRPGIVHRLDKDTSGLLLVARDDDTHQRLSDALKRRDIERIYLALAAGTMPAPSGSIEAPVGRHPSDRRRMAVIAEGRDAVTHYRVLQEGERCSYLEVRLESGRTHQIRVHLSHIKHPVIGDPVYGGRGDLSNALGLGRPFLHAARLAFAHPTTGRQIELSDPLPEELQTALERADLAPAHN